MSGQAHLADVVIIGFGIAGACAALEARAAGADVLVIERAAGGGGTSAISSGIFYLGGGTALQRELGVEDDTEALYNFMAASCAVPDLAMLRHFCEGSAAHFEWLEAQGVPFERRYFVDKHICPDTTEGLLSTGSEKVWPFRDIARPAVRGHRTAREGGHAGSLAMEVLLRRCEEEGIRVLTDTRCIDLLVDNKGSITGVTVRRNGAIEEVRARGGVILCTGGFQMNREMVARHAPHLLDKAEPIGVPYNDGSGIEMAARIGADLLAMDAVHATASFYPPSQLIKGVIVNAAGERFVAEDSYHGRIATHIIEQPGGKAWLIVDAEIFAYPELAAFFRYELVDGWETVAEMEAALAMPEGALQATLAAYNTGAAEGLDPMLGKYRDWLKPLDQGPYAAFDLSLGQALYHYHTLGGLRIDRHAAVWSRNGKAMPGLYAAGACTANIVQTAKGYGSGMTLAAGSFFGRVAGRNAASRVHQVAPMASPVSVS